ncbi:MAG: hypothetical protein AMXMBFR83_23390 [Phycisphaerae bacterium]
MNMPPVLCHRCGAELHPGSGDWYVVRIEAFADPSPPVITEADLRRSPGRELERLADALADLSPQEAMDQVYRRLTLSLCVACYRQWIENPVGE